MSKKVETPSHTGHRARLRERFLAKGDSCLADYEILEFLLFSAFPRKDVKPIAKDLIKHFGSLSAVLGAEVQRLKEVKGIGDTAAAQIKITQAAALHMLKEEHKNKPILSNWNSLMDYLRVAMGHLKIEQFRVLYLNTKNELISDEIQQEGTINATPVYPREIIRRALELGATALIMVHNHPSGDVRPSQGDIDITKQIIAVAQPLSIVIHDHIIVGKSETGSLKSMGYI
ncbi:MAG: RadC family protein [Alphaproteobacteria bacterium]